MIVKNINPPVRRTYQFVRGFTLIEMLISVTLVLLMMSLFAGVFFGATDSLSRQRGIAENDQRGRLLSITIRNDLNGRTFRDLLPFRSAEDTTQTTRPISRRAGYFEIDEGDPNDDTDDVLQFTASVNLPAINPNGTKFTGATNNLTSQPIQLISANPANTITINNINIAGPPSVFLDFAALVQPNSYIWISGSSYTDAAGHRLTYDGRYQVTTPLPPTGAATTTFTLNTTIPVAATILNSGNVLFSELDPDFDDGQVANGIAGSAFAEVCYYLRNGNLYRRALYIRDTQSGSSAQPQWNNGTSINTPAAPPLYPVTSSTITSTTFWRDFDSSAFFPPVGPANQISSQFGLLTAAFAPTGGVIFHNATESLNNSYVADSTILTSTLSLGLPYQRFGHSHVNGLPQDASTYATLPGADNAYYTADDIPVSLGRFNLQECSSWNSTLATNPRFGYPAVIPAHPITGAGSISPFDRRDIQVSSTTGLVNEYTTTNNRRGQDILLTNVLSFDVKVWDPINRMYVDIGSSSPDGGPFSVMPFAKLSPGNMPTGTSLSGGATVYSGEISVGANAVCGYTDGVLYNRDSSGNATVVGGRLNSTYASDPTTVPYGIAHAPSSYGYTSSTQNNAAATMDGRSHFRFDTWHPNAAINANPLTTPNATGTGFYNQPGNIAGSTNYFIRDLDPASYVNGNPIPVAPATGYVYTEPPFMPAAQLAVTSTTGATQTPQFQAFPLSSIQITINYRDISSKQIRSMTIVQSLIDRVQSVRRFLTPPVVAGGPCGVVDVPTLD